MTQDTTPDSTSASSAPSTSGSTSASSGSSTPASSAPPVPVLTDRQILVLNSVFTQLMTSPEYGASFLCDPRPILLVLGMTENDVVQIVTYFKYVRQLVEEDHGDDWV